MKQSRRISNAAVSDLILLRVAVAVVSTLLFCGVGHIKKNSTNVFSACRKRRLKETGRGDWESPPL